VENSVEREGKVPCRFEGAGLKKKKSGAEFALGEVSCKRPSGDGESKRKGSF